MKAVIMLGHIAVFYLWTLDLPAAVLMSPIAARLFEMAFSPRPVVASGEFISRPLGGWKVLR